MGTIRVVPALTNIATNPYVAPTTAGDGATLWGDSDDATFVEFWRSARGATIVGGSATGVTPPTSALTLDSATLYARAMLMDTELATAVGGIFVDVQRATDGSFLGEFSPVTQPGTLDAVVDMTDWTFAEAYPGALADMAAALPDGLSLTISRSNSGELSQPADWGLRVYELNLFLTAPDTGGWPVPAPCRLHPRDDDLGVGAGHVWPPPRTDMPGGYV